MNGNDCTPTSGSQLPGDDCVFIVNGPSGLESSVMGVPYLPGNDQWCDDTEQRYHHDDIPTKHNTMCDGQSVLSVVKQSPDFAGYTPMMIEIDTTPNFTILQPADFNSQAFSFILDYSNSMTDNGKTRLARLKQGIRRFMETDIDQLLKRSSTVTYGNSTQSLSNSLGSFSKASFVTSDVDGKDIDLKLLLWDSKLNSRHQAVQSLKGMATQG